MSWSDDELMEAARHASTKTYSPYSRFPVGAALLTDDGRMFDGCNIENASYGLTICAERCAVFSAIGAKAKKIVRIAVTCPKGDPSSPNTLMPCGACRQVLAEFAAPDLVVLIDGIDGIGAISFSELFPLPFQL